MTTLDKVLFAFHSRWLQSEKVTRAVGAHHLTIARTIARRKKKTDLN
jgi:hypothetical protein